MSVPPIRDPEQRKQDTLVKLRQWKADVWVASASPPSPTGASRPVHLVPLSLAWIDERIVLAVEPASRTAQNITGAGRARLGLGPTRDVVMVDAALERSVLADDPAAEDLGDRYAAQAAWDPRTTGDRYAYLVLRPERIQAWREADELPGRTLMRDGVWTV